MFVTAAAKGPGVKYFQRYQIGTNDTHAFVLDTITGRVWERPVPTESDQVDPSFYHEKAR